MGKMLLEIVVSIYHIFKLFQGVNLYVCIRDNYIIDWFEVWKNGILFKIDLCIDLENGGDIYRLILVICEMFI